jgi:hypothetical protein
MRLHLRSLALVALAISACGGDPKPEPQAASTGGDSEEMARIEKSKKKIAEANRAIDSKNYEKARKLLKEAEKLGVESHRFEISEALEKSDKRQAKLFVNEAQDPLKEKDCAGAFKMLAEQMQTMESEAFDREVRRLIEKNARACVQAAVDAATTAGDFAAARKLVNADDTKTVLGAEQKKVAAELDAVIGEVLKAKVDGDLKAKKWSQAVGQLDAMVKKGEASEQQAAVVLEGIRKAVAPEIAAMTARGIGQRDAAGALKAVDGLIQLVRWEVMDPSVGNLAKDKALPEDLWKKREALAIWGEAQKVGIKPVKKAEKRWTHGKVALLPATKSDGASKRDLAPATEVWVIGQSKTLALVAEADPGTALAAQLEKAIGWAPVDRLAKSTTADWLPPDDQLKGVRVWGPLRPPEKLLELGTVDEVAAKEIGVKRLADDKVIKVARSALRLGNLAPGTKVTSVCRGKDEAAKIEELLTAGRAVPAVRIKCDGGELKEEFLPALRAKPEFLPAAK